MPGTCPPILCRKFQGGYLYTLYVHSGRISSIHQPVVFCSSGDGSLMVMLMPLFHLQMVSFPAIYVWWLKGTPLDQWDKLAGELRSPYASMTKKTVRATMRNSFYKKSPSSDKKICWQNSFFRKMESQQLNCTPSITIHSWRGSCWAQHQHPTPSTSTAEKREDFR